MVHAAYGAAMVRLGILRTVEARIKELMSAQKKKNEKEKRKKEKEKKELAAKQVGAKFTRFMLTGLARGPPQERQTRCVYRGRPDAAG